MAGPQSEIVATERIVGATRFRSATGRLTPLRYIVHRHRRRSGLPNRF